MIKGSICCIPRTEAVSRAAAYLSGLGLTVTTRPQPDAAHLLLPVPSFSAADGYLAHILSDLPEDIIISGGNLDSPLLKDYRTVDFLQDPYYLASNAAITADCALQIAENQLSAPMNGLSALILGWGRIGKCLSLLLKSRGAEVTVAARKPEDLALIRALGMKSIPTANAAEGLDRYRLIFNTVPAMVLPNLDCRPDCAVIELASRPGMSGENIISALGLPGKMAPAASGKLIAETFLRLSL